MKNLIIIIGTIILGVIIVNTPRLGGQQFDQKRCAGHNRARHIEYRGNGYGRASMKEIIVICGTIMLGCFIFGRIYGSEDTISAATSEYMSHLTSHCGVLS